MTDDQCFLSGIRYRWAARVSLTCTCATIHHAQFSPPARRSAERAAVRRYDGSYC